MIYDAIAAGITVTNRLDISRKFLSGEWLEKERSDWTKKGPYSAKGYSDWDKLSVPKHLDAALTLLPAGSWYIQFTFTLATSYLSKGIEAFDLLDNPIIRDKVYGVPLVPASSWKGGLRAAALMHLLDGQAPDQRGEHRSDKDTLDALAMDAPMRRLFGNPKGAEGDFQAGRLHCFPTGFQMTKCEVINPHDRARRVGKQPILLECVPAGQQGTFTALYVPFGVSTFQESADDLILCVQAIHDLLLQWGIGAKKSDGNGLAKDEITLSLGPQKQTRPQVPVEPSLPDICRQYEARFGNDYQIVKPKAWKPHDGATFNDYKAARYAYQQYQQDYQQYERDKEQLEQAKSLPQTVGSQIATKLSKLQVMVKEFIAPQINGGK